MEWKLVSEWTEPAKGAIRFLADSHGWILGRYSGRKGDEWWINDAYYDGDDPPHWWIEVPPAPRGTTA